MVQKSRGQFQCDFLEGMMSWRSGAETIEGDVDAEGNLRLNPINRLLAYM